MAECGPAVCGVRRWCLLMVLWGLVVGPAAAEPVATRLPGWSGWRWTVEDGLPLNAVSGIAFDAHGLAWVATWDGLAHFDGDRFDVFRPANTPGLPSARIIDVAVDASDVLWLLTESGVVLRQTEGAFTPEEGLDDRVGRPSALLVLDGVVWVVAARGLRRLSTDDPVDLHTPGMDDGDNLRALRRTDAGWLAASTNGAVFRVDFDAVHAELVARIGRVEPATPLDDGDAGRPGVLEWVDGAVVGVRQGRLWWSRPDGRVVGQDLPGRHPLVVLDSAGDVRLRTTAGTFEATPDGLVALGTDAPPGVADDRWWVWDNSLYRGDQVVYEGAAGLDLLAVRPDGVWLADGNRGLLHVRRSPVSSLQADEHGRIGPLNTVMVDRDGALWMSGASGLRVRSADGTRRVVDPEGTPLGETLALTRDHNGRVWVSHPPWGCTIDTVPAEGPVVCVPLDVEAGRLDGRLFIHETRDGSLWSGAGRLDRRRVDGTTEHVVQPEGWVPFRAFAELADGSVLASAIGLGLWHVVAGEPTLRAGDVGSPLRSVRVMWVDERGDVWLGTEGSGLCRLEMSTGAGLVDAPLQCLGPEDGLADPFVSSIAPDGRGHLWLSSNRGLHAVRQAALRDRLAGRIDHLDMVSLGRRDGMIEPETNGVRKPSVARAPDGSLWYPTMDGAARLDPAAVARTEPPPVRVRSVSAPGRTLDTVPDRLTLEPHERELTVSWTAASFTRPEAVRFRYRLAGLDPDWRGPTALREASWTRLPPGRYTLEVQSGWEGRFGPTTTVTEVWVPPTFRETVWFTLLVGGGSLGLVGLLVWGRFRLVRNRARALARAVTVATGELESRNRLVQAQAARLEELDQVRTRFVANISHELRTPLTLIRGSLHDLVERSPPELARPVDLAFRNAERLGELVEQLFDVARLDAGGVPLRARRVDLGAWLRRTLERFEQTASARSVSLRLDIPTHAHPPEAWVDPDLMEKVVSNLVANGLDYCPAGGWLRVSLSWSTDAAVQAATIAVTDTGPGVPDALRERLFERFFQADDSDRRQRGGAGIGLALARELVALHGGDVSVHNEPGAGACFTVTLPLGSAHLSVDDVALFGPVDPPKPAEPVPSLEGDHAPVALLVEDHPDMRAWMAEHLATRFQVVVAEDGQAALERLEAGLVPAVVISDVMMPRLDGPGLCRTLRNDTRWSTLPVMLVSAKSTPADRIAGLQVADDYLTKPFRAVELVLRARRLAATSPATAQPATPDPPTEPPTPSAFLSRLTEVTDAHLSGADFGAARLAREFGLSQRQLQRRLREELGVTPAAWLRERRLLRARDLLRGGQVETVGEAAAQVGMSRSYLSRLYRQWAGHPASDELQSRTDAHP